MNIQPNLEIENEVLKLDHTYCRLSNHRKMDVHLFTDLIVQYIKSTQVSRDDKEIQE